jgi:hypothetical protein
MNLRDTTLDDTGCEALGSNELVAAADEFGNFIPVDCAAVQTESHPAFGSDGGGQIESTRLGGS